MKNMKKEYVVPSMAVQSMAAESMFAVSGEGCTPTKIEMNWSTNGGNASKDYEVLNKRENFDDFWE